MMRFIHVVFLFCLSVGCATAQTLTDDQIRDLQTRWYSPAKKKTILFYGDFVQRNLNPKTDISIINTYKRTGKVPFRLTAACGEVWDLKGGRQSIELYSLSASFYIMDEKGAVILQRQRSIIDMVDRQGSGGYVGDLPQPGTYTCVIWVKKENMLFGRKMTTIFTGYQ